MLMDVGVVDLVELISDEDGLCDETPPQDTHFVSQSSCSIIQKLAASSRSLTDLRICGMRLPTNLTSVLLSLCPSLKLLSCAFSAHKEQGSVPRFQLLCATGEQATWIHPHLQVLQTPYSTQDLHDLAVVPSLKALIVCGPCESNTPLQSVLRRLFYTQKRHYPEVRHLSLLRHGFHGADLDRVLLQSQEAQRGLHTVTWDNAFMSSPTTGMVRGFAQYIQANRDTLVHLGCPITSLHSTLQHDEVDEPPHTFPNLKTIELYDTRTTGHEEEAYLVLLEFLLLAPQLQQVHYTSDLPIHRAPSLGEAVLRLSPMRRVAFKFHVDNQGFSFLGHFADTIAIRSLVYHVEQLTVPVRCYHESLARKENGEPWDQVVRSGYVATVKRLSISIDCVDGNCCPMRVPMDIIQRFCQNLVDAGAYRTLEYLALPAIHPGDFDICRRMIEGACIALRRLTFSGNMIY